jgi:hypothetical protein
MSRRILTSAGIMALLIAGLSITPTRADSNAKQIAFSVNGYYFQTLRVEGNNQDNQPSTWTDPDWSPKLLTITQNYWWQDTLVLSFYVDGLGWRGCVIDYLNDGGDGQLAAVVYTEGSGCSGDLGGGRVIITDNNAQQIHNADDWIGPWECVSSIASGSSFGVFTDCWQYLR